MMQSHDAMQSQSFNHLLVDRLSFLWVDLKLGDEMGCDPSAGQIYTINVDFSIIIHTVSFGGSVLGDALYCDSIDLYYRWLQGALHLYMWQTVDHNHAN